MEEVRCGHYIGIRKEGVDIYRGITFARCERFREAVIEPAPSEDVDATTWGSVCPQRSSRLAYILGEDKGPVCEEGRLCLSIYAPEGGHDLPVMVWIHGGAFITGGSEEHRYSGERLVKTGNVVVVKISYRLGALGYLYLPDQGISNLGLKDQRTALEWIHREIAAFGGDPNDITLFGQSAGAQSIAALVATSTEKPVFNKVIMESAPLGMSITREKASQIAAAFCRKLGKSLYEASVDEILDAQAGVLGMKAGMAFMPVIDDCTYVPESVVSSGLKFVAGYATEDASPFVMGALGKLFDSFVGRTVTHFVTRKIFSSPAKKYVSKLRSLGLQAQNYCISWHPSGNPMGACHCIEMPFILGERCDWAESPMLRGITDDEFEANSRVCLRAWTEFANRGKFKGEGIIIAD